MKDSLSPSISMIRDDTNRSQEQKTPDYRLVSNPFDPPTSVHLKQRLASFSIFNEVSIFKIMYRNYLNLFFYVCSNRRTIPPTMFCPSNVVLKSTHIN